MDTQRINNQSNNNPQRLSPKAIKDFQEAYFAEFGTNITLEQAQLDGLRWLRFFKFVYRPIPVKSNQEKYGEK